MEPCSSSLKAVSHSPCTHCASSSVKKAAPQDESDEVLAQKLPENACSSTTTSGTAMLQKVVPLPPLPPAKSSSSSSCESRWSAGSGCWVSKEVAESWDQLFIKSDGADVIVVTEDGSSFRVHSFVLMSASLVFRSLFEKHWVRKAAKCKIMIGGVPTGAATMFMRLLYSSKYNNADMEKYVLHLLVLSHVYDVPFVKRLCGDQLEQRLLTVDNVIDVLQLARLCNAPRLNLMCLRLIIYEFKSVANTEGWRAMRESDPSLEQELVEAVVDADCRRKDKIRKLEEEKVYGQLRDAMEALVHICRDGCRTIGPHDKAFDGRHLGPCNFPACKGLESLVRHFAGCRIKVPGGCVHCKRMWQLLELHSRMCQEVDICRVPLCRHFKEKLGNQSKKDENKWRLLVTKVTTARRKTNAFSLATVSARLAEE